MTKRIEAIAGLPEIRLGQGQRPPFNARRVAEILRGWIRGDSLRDLTVKYSVSKERGKRADWSILELPLLAVNCESIMGARCPRNSLIGPFAGTAMERSRICAIHGLFWC